MPASPPLVVSGDLNEYKIDRLVRNGAPIDLFGVGTEMVTSRDDPALAVIYKLVEKKPGHAWAPVMKSSAGKPSFPGRKQLFRRVARGGRFLGDAIGLAHERRDGVPLLKCVMRGGRILGKLPSLHAIRERALRQVASLSEPMRGLSPSRTYPVHISEELRRVRASLSELDGGIDR